jgi:6-phosphofructokinase 2
MTPILTVTLNPALDLATHVGQVIPGHKLRCAAPRLDPGGGGINVSRAIRRLGGASLAFVALAGGTGAQVAEFLHGEGITLVTFPGPGETRQSLTVSEETTGKQYRFMLPGAPWDAERIAAVERALAEASPLTGAVVLSGSAPPGLPVDFPARLAEDLHARHESRTRLVADTSGASLKRIATGPATSIDLLRMDQEEAEDLAGHALISATQTADFAAALVARGSARRVIVARGADGSVLVAPGVRLSVRPPSVPVKSKVGAGDSFVAGFVLAEARGASPGEALAHGVAAAAAAVMSEGTELCRQEDADAIYRECVTERV